MITFWDIVKNVRQNGNNKMPGSSASDSPTFARDLMNEYDPKPRSINSVMYDDMIREKAGPAVRQVYPDGSAVFKDDGATIRRAAISLDAVAETFKSRVDYRPQAPKMADIWSIENVWVILKDKVAQKKVDKRTAATESDCSSLGGD